MMALLVSVLLLALAAPYLLYPLWLLLRARLRPRPVRSADITPPVDLVICAYNEAASIAARIDNALALDYPADALTIWIASDGSDDATVAIARRYAGERVRILDLPRGGKAAALSAAVNAGRSEVIAFSDANSEWAPGALRALVRPLADPEVGGVAGDQRYRRPQAQGSADESVGERGYWSCDRMLKRWQSRSGSVISATGAIYAIRRPLFQAPPPDATDDFMISTGVIAQGRRLVFAADAVAFEPPAARTGAEFQRKVRILTRGLASVLHRAALLDPRRYGVYAIDLLLHKLLRRQAWIALVLLALLAPFYAGRGPLLAGLAGGVLGALAAGALALALPPLRRLPGLAVAGYVLMVNAACAVATLRVLTGRRVSRWSTQRTAPARERP